ncbi:hypothetical protein F511_39314 [Dorcoceras hygrometricum]|uniref:Uncharacterized protein n=1 Tax=Dorcoceras hygrometricum TaxID=472368 RepID=A0A2Z7BQK8_9LAMI|nr:hypothetical protein F511_39314 [Dorcoceras hygrometricum]
MQNVVVSTYSRDIILQSPTSNTNCWLYCDSLLIDLPVRRRFSLALLFTTAGHDVVTNDIIIDGPFRCFSWFSFDVPADPSSSSSACSWFISFQLIHFAPAGSTWPSPDFEHLT